MNGRARSSSSGPMSRSVASRTRSSMPTKWRCSSTPARSWRPWGRAGTRSTPTSCPGLGALIDFATGGNAYRAELYFVGTREYTGFRFGGRVDDVQDPRTGLVVTLRVFGEYAMRVIDPARLITNLTATVDVTDNERIAGWVSEQLLKVLRTNVTTQVVANGWPILGLSVHSPEIEQAAITSSNGQLEAYGIALTRMGNFDINLRRRGRQAAQAARQGHLLLPAGRRLPAVRGRRDGARRRAGHGPGRRRDRGRVPRGRLRAARDDGRRDAAAAAAPRRHRPPQAPPAAPAPATAAGPACASCSTPNPAGAKFCMGCGTADRPGRQALHRVRERAARRRRSSAPTAAPGRLSRLAAAEPPARTRPRRGYPGYADRWPSSVAGGPFCRVPVTRSHCEQTGTPDGVRGVTFSLWPGSRCSTPR